jgi:hypothetical protein
MKNLKYALLAAATLFAAPQAFACYTVYNQYNQIIYNAQTPPVDMSYQIHEVLPRVFPGATMVFGDEPGCPLTSAVYVSRQAATALGARSGGAGRFPPKPYRN